MPVRKLSPELEEKARKELNEDPKKIEDDLQHIKEWLAKQPHIRARTDDQWLIAFLRTCKYSLERAKEKLDMFYTIRSTAPEFTRLKYNDKKFKEILDLGAIVVLPKIAAPDAPRVVMIRPGAYDANKVHILDVMGVSSVIQKIMFIEDDNSVVAGIQNIVDLDGVTMSHFTQMTPMLMKKMAVATQDAAPIRMKGAHYLNTPNGFETIYNMAKMFLNEKNKNRLFVHNKNYEEMYKHIPKQILPAEYGGEGGTIREIIEYWKKKIEEYGPWLEEEDTFGTDESKRPGKPKTAEDLFGLEGSFRQLDFD